MGGGGSRGVGGAGVDGGALGAQSAEIFSDAHSGTSYRSTQMAQRSLERIESGQ